MIFDSTEEPLITFSALSKKLPLGDDGRAVSISTLHRWRSRGVAGGITLDATRVGGRWCTTWSAFNRFNAQVTAAKSSPPPLPSQAGSDLASDSSLSASDLSWG